MGLEVATYISDLVATNPLSSDLASTGDDHIRLLKSTVKTTFPNIAGAVTPTDTELNYVDGVTSAIQTQLDSKPTASTGTYTGTLVGCTTSPTVTVKWARNGNLVTITIPAMTGTSNSTGMSVTGSLPAAIQPTDSQWMSVHPIEDAGGFSFAAAVNVAPGSSALTFSKNGSSTGWTNSGVKGISSQISFTYLLN